jgi:hypothetical protein
MLFGIFLKYGITAKILIPYQHQRRLNTTTLIRAEATVFCGF